MNTNYLHKYVTNIQTELDQVDPSYLMDHFYICKSLFLQCCMLSYLTTKGIINDPIVDYQSFYEMRQAIKERYPNHTSFFIEFSNEEPLFQVFQQCFQKDLQDKFTCVETLGYLYQSFQDRKRNTIINTIKKKPLVNQELKYATQIFTPLWMVEYLLHNTLGLFAYHNGFMDYSQALTYFIPQTIHSNECKPIESWTLLDPCCGSGFFLTKAFDMFMDLYTSIHIPANTAVKAILTNHLYGLDIDEDLCNLSKFLLLCKQFEYDPSTIKHPYAANIYCIHNLEIPSCSKKTRHVLQNAETIGSLLPKDMIHTVSNIDYIDVLNNQYDIVVTNPPYLNKFDPTFKTFLKTYYPTAKQDLFSCFIVKDLELVKKDGYCGYLTPMVFMFTKRFEKLRYDLLTKHSIKSLALLKYASMDDATVPLTMFVLQNHPNKEDTIFFDLFNTPTKKLPQKEILQQAIHTKKAPYAYKYPQKLFLSLPSYTLSFWMEEALFKAFLESVPMRECMDVKQGLATSDNKRFLSYWWEIPFNKIYFSAGSIEDAIQSKYEYFPYNKGGMRCKWYGNYEYVIHFKDGGKEIEDLVLKKYPYLNNPGFVVKNKDYYFKEALTYSLISTGTFSMRYREQGSIHDVSGMSAFYNGSLNMYYVLGLCNSLVAQTIIPLLNPTMNMQVGDFQNFPVKTLPKSKEKEVIAVVKKCVQLSKDDFNASELSYHFKQHPLLPYLYQTSSYKEAIQNYINDNHTAFYKQVDLEVQLNKIFYDLYNIEEPKNLKDIVIKDSTHSYITNEKEVSYSFLSYLVGIAHKRYSFDFEGVISNETHYTLNVELTLKTIQNLFQDVYQQQANQELTYFINSLGCTTDFSTFLTSNFLSFHNKQYKKHPIYKKD